jgi:hypothetical protein
MDYIHRSLQKTALSLFPLHVLQASSAATLELLRQPDDILRGAETADEPVVSRTPL